MVYEVRLVAVFFYERLKSVIICKNLKCILEGKLSGDTMWHKLLFIWAEWEHYRLAKELRAVLLSRFVTLHLGLKSLVRI